MKTNNKFQVGQKLSWGTVIENKFSLVRGEITKIVSVDDLKVSSGAVLITFEAEGEDQQGRAVRSLLYDADPTTDFVLFARKEIESKYPHFQDLFLSKLPDSERFGEVYTEKQVQKFLETCFKPSYLKEYSPKTEEQKKTFYLSLFERLDRIQNSHYKGIFND